MNELESRRLKVIFVGMRWDYKDPSRGPSFEYYNFWHTLENMPGVDAELFPFDEVEAAHGRPAMRTMLRERVDAFGPDIVFFFLFEDEFDAESLERLSRDQTTVNWFADDQWRFDTFSRHVAPFLTWVATTDPIAASRYRELGHDNVFETQWGCNHFLYGPRDLVRNIDCSFVGQPHGTREAAIRGLRDKGVQVRTHGSGWPEGRVSQPEMIDLFSRTKVNLNLSNASARPGIRGLAGLLVRRDRGKLRPDLGNVLSNARVARAKRQDQIKGRNFEIPGCRTCLLTTAVQGLERYYVYGREIEVFETDDELYEKTVDLLQDEERREAIALAGYERTMTEHTYERRFGDLFRTMGFTFE